jgi:hypothetical protein
MPYCSSGSGCVPSPLTASGIPALKQVVRAVSIKQCEKIAKKAISLDSETEVAAYLRDQVRTLVPEAFRGYWPTTAERDRAHHEPDPRRGPRTQSRPRARHLPPPARTDRPPPPRDRAPPGTRPRARRRETGPSTITQGRHKRPTRARMTPTTINTGPMHTLFRRATLHGPRRNDDPVDRHPVGGTHREHGRWPTTRPPRTPASDSHTRRNHHRQLRPTASTDGKRRPGTPSRSQPQRPRPRSPPRSGRARRPPV